MVSKTLCPACGRSIPANARKEMGVHQPVELNKTPAPEQTGKDCVGTGRTPERVMEIIDAGRVVDSGRTWIPHTAATARGRPKKTPR